MKRYFILATIVELMLWFASCSKDNEAELTPSGKEYKSQELTFADHYEITPLADRVVSLGTYTSIDEDKALADVENLDMDKGGCSSCCKVLNNGELIFGRNMDLAISEESVYMFKTSFGKYKTMNLMYIYGLGPSYGELIQKVASGEGLDEKITNLIPYMALDVLNEKGLYMASHMRPPEYDEQGKNIFATTGTNPGKKHVYIISLAQYLGTRCANVDEMLEELKNIDVYSTSKFTDWPMGYLVGDASGRHGVLEFINNEVFFAEDADVHTNFFINEKYRTMEKGPQGLGRYDVLKAGLPAVSGEYDMHKLMEEIYYSYLLRDYLIGKPYQHADFRSEYSLSIPLNDKGEFDMENGDSSRSTIDWVLDPKNEAIVTEAAYTDAYYYLVTLDETQRRATHNVWNTTIHNVTNVNKGTMTVQLWEDPYKTYSLKWEK